MVVDVVHVLQEGDLPGADLGLRLGHAREQEVLRRGGPVPALGPHDPELHDPPGRRRVRGLEVYARLAAAVGLVRPDVGQPVVALRHGGEVDDDVGPLGRAEQQPQAVRGQVVWRRQEAAIVADLVDPHPRDARPVEDEEARRSR